MNWPKSVNFSLSSGLGALAPRPVSFQVSSNGYAHLLSEDFNPDSIRIHNVGPSTRLRLHLLNQREAGLLSLGCKLVKILDMESQVIQTLANGIVGRKLTPLLVMIQFERVSFLIRQTHILALGFFMFGSVGDLHAQNLGVEGNRLLKVLDSNSCVHEFCFHI